MDAEMAFNQALAAPGKLVYDLFVGTGSILVAVTHFGALPVVPELKNVVDITERKESPHWDFDEIDECWKWKKTEPASRIYKNGNGKNVVRKSCNKSDEEKILKEFSCLLCRKVMNFRVTAPCTHNFCKSCLDGAFVGQAFVRERSKGGRQLRTQKNVMKCPTSATDIIEFLQNVQVNRELMGTIELLQRKIKYEKATAEGEEAAAKGEEAAAAAAAAGEEEISLRDNEEEDATSEDSENLHLESDEIVTKDAPTKAANDIEAVQNVTNVNPKEVVPEAKSKPTVRVLKRFLVNI